MSEQEAVQKEEQQQGDVTWVARSGHILDTLQALGLPNGKEALFNPLPLEFRPGGLRCTSQSQAKTSFLVAEIDDPGISSEGSVVVNVLELIKFVKLYEPGEEVVITFSDPIVIQGATRRSTVHPDGSAPTPLGGAVPEFKDGVVQFKSGPPTAFLSVDVSTLSGLLQDAKTVDVPTFPLRATPDGLVVELGSAEAKKNSITRTIPVNIDGDEGSVRVGEDFAYVLGQAKGVLHLQMKDKHPLVVTNSGIHYVLLPRVE